MGRSAQNRNNNNRYHRYLSQSFIFRAKPDDYKMHKRTIMCTRVKDKSFSAIIKKKYSIIQKKKNLPCLKVSLYMIIL